MNVQAIALMDFAIREGELARTQVERAQVRSIEAAVPIPQRMLRLDLRWSDTRHNILQHAAVLSIPGLAICFGHERLDAGFAVGTVLAGAYLDSTRPRE